MICVGDKVLLKAETTEGWLEEVGTVLDISDADAILVMLDEKYWQSAPHESPDDGLREVTLEQIVGVL